MKLIRLVNHEFNAVDKVFHSILFLLYKLMYVYVVSSESIWCVVGFCTLCFYFPTKMVLPQQVTKMLT